MHGFNFAISARWVAVVFGTLLLLPARGADPLKIDPLLLKAEEERIAAIEKAKPSAVSVFVPGGAGGGSGVLISPDGYALTNFHVTSPAGSYMRCGISDGNIYDAVIVGIDPVGDLALIRLLGRDDFPFAKLGDSRLAKAGDWCMVIGNPFLLASNLQPTVTWGILSGVGRYQYPSGTLLEYADCLQTDASINPGNSGGPLYDANGDLLGIVGRASFEKRGRVNVGVGYAISIHQAKNFLGYLYSGRIVDHATLGATVATDSDGGVRVTNIIESSDAYRRGLRYQAEILEIDGRAVQTANDVQNVLGTLPANWRVKLAFRHEGETTETLVRLRTVHRRDELLKKMASALPPPPPRPQEEKKDDEEPKEGEDKPDEKKNPHRRQRSAPKKPPKAVAELIKAREGYANYHFNTLQQDKFIETLRKQPPGGEPDQDVDWVIEGETDEPNPVQVQIRLSDDGCAMIVGQKAFETKNKADLYDAVERRDMSGMIPALDAWRRMIADGPKRFGESYYLGTMPLGGERPLRHCMIGIDGEMEIRWLYHPGQLLVEAVEVFSDQDMDPAELWLIREQGQDAPSVLDLRYGVESILRVRVKSWKANAPAANPAGANDGEVKA